MKTHLELKEFNTLRHRVATGLNRLDNLSNSTMMGDQALRGLALMKEDGKKAREVLDAASKERELPTSFVVELENWLSKVEEITVSVDSGEETSR